MSVIARVVAKDDNLKSKSSGVSVVDKIYGLIVIDSDNPNNSYNFIQSSSLTSAGISLSPDGILRIPSTVTIMTSIGIVVKNIKTGGTKTGSVTVGSIAAGTDVTLL